MDDFDVFDLFGEMPFDFETDIEPAPHREGTSAKSANKEKKEKKENKKKKDKKKSDHSDGSDLDIFGNSPATPKKEKKKKKKKDKSGASDSGYDTPPSSKPQTGKQAAKDTGTMKSAGQAAAPAAVASVASTSAKKEAKGPLGPDGRPKAVPSASPGVAVAQKAKSSDSNAKSSPGSSVAAKNVPLASRSAPSTSASSSAKLPSGTSMDKREQGKSVTISDPETDRTDDEDAPFVESKLSSSILRAFKTMDSDGDGVIDMSELRRRLDHITANLGIKVARDTAEDVLAKFDPHGEHSFLDLDQFGCLMDALKESASAKTRVSTHGDKPTPSWYKHPHIPPAVRHAFEACDMDETGSIHASELRRMFTMLDRQLGFTVTRRATDEVLAKYDGSATDRRVSADEFAALVDELQAISPQALAASLDSPDVRIRWRAASDLKKDPAALESQAKSISLKLAHQDPGVRLVALDVLTACRSQVLAPVAPQVSSLLADPVWYVREASVLCLASLEPHILRDYAIELIDALDDEYDVVGSSVRQAAVQALSKMKPESISSYLLSRTREITKKASAVRPSLKAPPRPAHTQPSMLTKTVNKVRPGSSISSRHIPASVRFSAEVPGHRPNLAACASASDAPLRDSTVVRPGDLACRAPGATTPASENWAGVCLPEEMSNGRVRSEVGFPIPDGRPSRLDSAHKRAGQQGVNGFQDEEPMVRSLRGDKTVSTQMPQPPPIRMSSPTDHVTAHFDRTVELGAIQQLQRQQMEMQQVQQQQLHIQHQQLQQLQQHLHSSFSPQREQQPQAVLHACNGEPCEATASSLTQTSTQSFSAPSFPNAALAHHAVARQHRDAASANLAELQYERDPPTKKPSLAAFAAQMPTQRRTLAQSQNQHSHQKLSSLPSSQSPAKPAQNTPLPRSGTVSRNSSLSPYDPKANTGLFVDDDVTPPERVALTQPQFTDSHRDPRLFASIGYPRSRRGGPMSSTPTPQLGQVLLSTTSLKPQSGACTAIETYDGSRRQETNGATGHTWSSERSPNNSWDGELITRDDILDLKRELATLREELDLRRQMQSLVSETRDLRSEVISEARGLRAELLSEARGLREDSCIQESQESSWSPHDLTRSTFAASPSPSRLQSAHGRALMETPTPQAVPPFPAWAQRPVPDTSVTSTQAYTPVRNHSHQTVTVIPNQRPSEPLATPLETLVRHLGSQAAAPAMRPPSQPMAKAGLPRPHAQKSTQMTLSTPGLI
mmetsp:Transcript_11270/g.31227  ORF Transcript_11270/g.31227 Transcript_11270/m.31227 type:complete len:1240 (+) Transcript_11270:127-3846(+)